MKHYKLDFTKRDLQNWLKEEVEFLKDNEAYSGSYFKLNNSSIYETEDLAAVICWEPGFGNEHRDDCIQSKEEPDYALCVGVKIYNPNDTCDAWNFPIDEDTNDILCDSISLEESDSLDKFSHIADFIINSYEECLSYYEEHSEEEPNKINEDKSSNLYYECEQGITLDKSDREYDSYKFSDVYGGKFSFYDTYQDVFVASDLKSLIKNCEDYVKNGEVGAYAIIKGPYKGSDELIQSIEDADVGDYEMNYSLADVIFAIRKSENGKIIKDFLD